jgi:hypothetical protein
VFLEDDPSVIFKMNAATARFVQDDRAEERSFGRWPGT